MELKQDFDLEQQQALELGALPHAPMDMPVQVLESPAMQAVMQAGGVLPFLLRHLTAPWAAARAGH